MILCLDVGNSNIYGGIVDREQILLRFRMTSSRSHTSDQFGIFLKSVLRENAIDSNQIKQIAICSVVPHLDYSLTSACHKYFKLEPFMLQAANQQGLTIKYDSPQEVGADRIANALAAIKRHPNKNMIIVDFGTATTFCVINAKRDYLGGVIMPGIRLAMESLQKNTAKLSSVEIIKPDTVVGQATDPSIQSGLFYSQVGAIKHITQKIINENFVDESVYIIGTGGFARLFEDENLFDEIEPDLVLFGLASIVNTST